MFIVHLSDLHFSANGGLAEENLDKLVHDIKKIERKPDLILVSGDLVHQERSDYYEKVFSYLDKIGVPYFVVPGNHDNSIELMDYMKKNVPEHPKSEIKNHFHYVCDDFPLRIIAMDSYKKNCHNGSISKEGIEWLKEKLEDGKPSVILLHHYPDYTGMPSFDNLEENWFENIQSVIADNKDKIKLIASGHLHLNYNSQINGVNVVSAPSLNVAMELNFNSLEHIPDKDGRVGYLIHIWDGEKFRTVSRYL
jgi:3',5'-cyclic AMP phosphodiesterase CpdA